MLGNINPLSTSNRMHYVLTRKGFKPRIHPDSELSVIYTKGSMDVYIDGDVATCTDLNLTDVPLRKALKVIKKYH